MLTKITRVPVTKEDLTIGFKKETQIRNAGLADYTQINAANIKGVAYINTFTELKAIDTDTIDADSLFIVRETDDIYIYRYDRNSTASENLVYNTILAPYDNKGRFIKISNITTIESNVLSYLNEFKETYYGAYSSDPTTDPLGNPVDTGDIYYNTTEGKLKYWTGSTWDSYLQASSYTASDVLTKIKTVDGSGSGLDADMLDGFHASQTPQPNTIPVANSSGKIDDGWLNFVANDPKVKTALNASGGAPIYACRAWVNFDGTTNPPTIRASGNVSSIVKNVTGEYTVNFAVALPSINYVVSGSAYGIPDISYNSFVAGVAKNTTSCIITVSKINGSNTGLLYDSPDVSVAFIGG